MTMKNVEDIYPLSPMQQGILFHTLHDPVFASYFEIITWTIHGEVNVAAFGEAWQRTVERHPVLRTAFVWEGLDEPLQVVRKRAKLPLAFEDWRELTPAEQDERLAQFFAEERARGFKLSKAPLMRIALMQTGADSYRFVWSYHHGLVDGWSCSLIFNDVFAFYETLHQGVTVDLPPPRSFRDYIEWVRRQELAQAEQYWRRTLKGFTAATPVGVGAAPHGDLSEAAEETRSYREQQFALSTETTGQLVQLARQHQLTLNTICQGAWAVLLNRYSGERDVVFGVAVTGRPPVIPGIESMVGMLVNTLPARVEVRPRASLIEWLKEIQNGQAEMRQYEYSPLVEVQGWSDVPRGLPLFETIVSFENHPVDYSLLKRSKRAELRDVVHHHTATGYPVNVIIEPGAQLLIKILYDFGRFDDATIERMLRHLTQLLESIAAAPHTRLSELSMLTTTETRLLIEGWNDAPRVTPGRDSIHAMFEAQVERTPDRVALMHEHESLTYRELNRRANLLARRLRELGVGLEVPVALCVERTPQMLVAMLAILKAGGAYVALDPTYPPERLALILEDTQAPVVLTFERFVGLFPERALAGKQVVRLDAEQAADGREGEPFNPAAARAMGDHLAYLIYTSGSTGRPKGVAITHSSVAVFLHWAREVFSDEELSGVLASTSINFDLSVFELFAPLSWGGKVILAENALQLPTLDAAGQVTLVNTVPSAMTELLRMKGVPAGVRTVNLAGEPLPLRLARQLYEQSAVGRVLNLYGPSEDTTYSTFAQVERSEEEAPSIGRAVSNTQAYLLDERMQPVPVGVAGELYLGGEGLARGYFKRPALTAERFVPDPFARRVGARLYRTGDLGRWRPDGQLEFLGRRDQQVKLRGFRIEPGEIEAAVAGHSAVAECVVTLREDVPGDRRLVAYVVPARHQALPLRPRLNGEAERLLAERQHLKLPNGMIVAGHSSLQTSGVYREIFEDLIYLKHGIRLQEGDCVFDVGANIGLFTLFVKQHARRARVYAFEPLPPNFDVLRTNVDLYGLDVKLFECGLSRTSETTTFTFYPHAAAMSGRGSHVEEDKLATKANVQSWLHTFEEAGGGKAEYGLDEFVEQYLQSESYTCQLKTLSEVIREQNVERIDLLKLDVEKSEYDVLVGIEEEDWQRIQQLVIEVHTEELLHRITRLLQERGFTFAVENSTLVEQSGQDIVRVYMLYARRAAANGQVQAAVESAPPAAAAPMLSSGELREHLREKLPEYMVPSAFVLLDELPLTPNGKLDRRALPAPDAAEHGDERGYVAPRTPLEEIVAGICASVLGVERVGVRDNFFELGGHSLLAAQVITHVRETFKIDLSLRKLFLNPTVEGLAQNVEASLRAGEETAVSRIDRIPRDGAPLPLSSSQQRLWFLNQLEPESPFYNIPFAVRLEGSLNFDALARTLREVVRRHEILRTSFAATDGEPVQIIEPEVAFPFEVEDLRASADPDGAARRIAAAEATRPFDLSRSPLFRVRLLRLADDSYLTLLTLHHIVSDGWSIGVLIREVAALYEAFTKNEPSPLAELPIQYADYAVWQRERLQGAFLEEQLSYWRTQLAAAPPVLELSTDRPRPAVHTYDGGAVSFSVDASLAARLHELSRSRRATLFMTLLAAFKLLLSRYAAQSDICVGTPIANRDRAETDHLIGFFVNTLVLRTHLNADEDFHALLERVRETTLGAYAHQDVPLERLVEELQPERSLSHTPLFQVMFALQNAPLGELQLPGLSLEAIATENAAEKFELTLTMGEDAAGGLAASLTYNKHLFRAETVKQMTEHYLTLLQSIVAETREPVRQLRMMSVEEERELVEGLNATQEDYAREVCLHELFEAQARRTPDAVAVLFDDERMTYSQLDRQADELARRLRALGVGPDVVVGMLLERSPAMIVAMLATMKAGGAYVPLEATAPAPRLEWMLEDSGARVLLTQASLAQKLESYDGAVISLDERQADPVEQAAQTSTQARLGAESLAYVMYTSGSTGRPKGAMVPHRGIVNCLHWLQTNYPLDADSRFLMRTPVTFDPSVWEVFWPLTTGAAVVLAREGEHTNTVYLSKLIRRERITNIYMVPSLLQLFVEEPGLEESARTVRLAISGGEKLAPEVGQRFAERLKGAVLLHSYGPTETSIAATNWEWDTSAQPETVFMGGPQANVRVYVLDERMQPVARGVKGELYIGGECVGRGYLNKPALTAQSFVPDPFTAEAGARLYRTGDVVRVHRNNLLEFIGRRDAQVKVRGIRLEVGEVEGALKEDERVTEAVVVARKDARGGVRLVGYVTLRADGSVSGDELRKSLRSRLPEYMVPSVVVVLEQLPMLASGKVDRRALPEVDAQGGRTEAFIAPRTSTEKTVAEVWAGLLGVERIGADDNFFELGGHSLLATQVVSRLRSALDVTVPLRRLFERPTVAELSQSIDEQAESREATPAEESMRRTHTAAAPLSFAQQRLWFLHRLEPDTAAYHMPALFRAEGRLNVEALEAAFNEVVRRHDVLRTSFRVSNGEPVQVVAAYRPLPLPLVDLSHLTGTRLEEELERHRRQEVESTFDLEQGPLVRAKVLRLSADEHMLVFVMHHIIGDGWSLGILAREVVALYEAFAQGRPSPLPDLSIQYADFATWQRAWLTGERLAGQLGYWQQLLAGAPPALDLPADRPRPAVQSFRGRQFTFTLSAATLEKLKALGQREGTTLFMTLLAAFDALLSRYTGEAEVVVGTPIANRRSREVEDLIGLFVNTLVLKTDLSGNPTFRELLGRVREVTLGAYAHQDMPFERLVEELQPERELSRNPLFQVTFALQNMPHGIFELPGLKLSHLEMETGLTRFDLECYMREVSGGLAGLVVYSTDLFDEATVRRLFRHFEALLEAVVADPTRPLADLPLLSSAEEQRLLSEWSEGPAPAHAVACVHRLFAAQAARTPDATALLCDGVRLSYAELDARANRRAHLLRACGVGPDGVVGICQTRSVEMIISVLAVLKAGGAYLPLDPEAARERLAFILDDAGARVLLTQSSLQERLPHTSARIVLVDDEANAAAYDEERAPDEATPDHLACVIYTSGSTDRPEGIAMPHRPLANLLAWQLGRSAPSPRTLQFAPLDSGVAFQEMFSTLLTGATLVLVGDDVRRDAGALLRVLVRERVERLFLPFAALQALGEAAERERLLPHDLREVITAGEQLKMTRHVRAFFSGLDGCTLDNQYGLSEAHVVAAHRLSGEAGLWPEVPPVGRPIAGTQVYVLDEAMAPVPIGVTGELYVGGAGLARGYLNRPEVTAERFVVQPAHGTRLYCSGDLARWRADGQIELLGRRDRQFRVRGYRIKTDEVEATLRRHVLVRDALAVVREARPGERSLVAYVLAEEVTAHELREHLRSRLPEYMMPAAFVLMETFPTTPGGKVDLRALPEPVYEDPSEETSRPPHTPDEELLCSIWAEVLGQSRIGTDDNFFDLGGHSLLATQVVSRLHAATGIEVPLRDFFRHPTVAELAAIIQGREARPQPAALALERGEHVGELPLSFAQQRLWFWEQLHPGTPTYVLTTALRFKGEIDLNALEEMLNEVVRRHDTLRASFKVADGRPVQVIAPTASVKLQLIDLSHLPAAEREQEARRLAEAESLRPFDLTQAPLMRAILLRLGQREHVAIFSIHHIVSDGWSAGVLVGEVAALYRAFLTGLPSPLPALPIQYADFVRWQQESLQGAKLQSHLDYWREKLAGAPDSFELTTDHPRPPVQNSVGASVSFDLPMSLAEELRALSRKQGVTLYMTLLAAFEALLHRYTAKSDVVVGADIANRNRVETEKLIGFFVNMLVLRTDLSGDPTFVELLGRVREVTLGAYAHQDVPFAMLVDELHVERTLNRNPLFQIVFVLQNAPAQPLELPGLTFEPFPFDVKTSPFDLVFALAETEEGITGVVTYAAGLFNEETIKRLLGHYRTALEGILADPDRRLSSLPIMFDGEGGNAAVPGFRMKLSQKNLESLVLELSEAGRPE